MSHDTQRTPEGERLLTEGAWLLRSRSKPATVGAQCFCDGHGCEPAMAGDNAGGLVRDPPRHGLDPDGPKSPRIVMRCAPRASNGPNHLGCGPGWAGNAPAPAKGRVPAAAVELAGSHLRLDLRFHVDRLSAQDTHTHTATGPQGARNEDTPVSGVGVQELRRFGWERLAGCSSRVDRRAAIGTAAGDRWSTRHLDVNERLRPVLRGADQPGDLSRRREFCHFADTPSPSLLKHLQKEEGGAIE